MRACTNGDCINDGACTCRQRTPEHQERQYRRRVTKEHRYVVIWMIFLTKITTLQSHTRTYTANQKMTTAATTAVQAGEDSEDVDDNSYCARRHMMGMTVTVTMILNRCNR